MRCGSGSAAIADTPWPQSSAAYSIAVTWPGKFDHCASRTSGTGPPELRRSSSTGASASLSLPSTRCPLPATWNTGCQAGTAESIHNPSRTLPPFGAPREHLTGSIEHVQNGIICTAASSGDRLDMGGQLTRGPSSAPDHGTAEHAARITAQGARVTPVRSGSTGCLRVLPNARPGWPDHVCRCRSQHFELLHGRETVHWVCCRHDSLAHPLREGAVSSVRRGIRDKHAAEQYRAPKAAPASARAGPPRPRGHRC